MSQQLEQLGNFTKIVADTGDIESIKKYHPVDATTNPSLLLAAVKDNKYAHLIEDAIKYGLSKAKNDVEAAVPIVMDKLAVNFGAEITKIVPGVVSTEVDARLSFSVEESVSKGRALIDMYKEVGIDKNRVLIKLATTWEGVQAAKQLESEGIHCNMTLLFCKAQAVAAAEAKVTLISPFVGRITDWYKKSTGTKDYAPHDDPGVKSVVEIYRYYKTFGYPTIVMGASFRSKAQVLALAGCDKLTISPALLEELKNSNDEVKQVLQADFKDDSLKKETYDESAFRFALNEDQMATEKLSEGIRLFAQAARDLEKIVRETIKKHAEDK